MIIEGTCICIHFPVAGRLQITYKLPPLEFQPIPILLWLFPTIGLQIQKWPVGFNFAGSVFDHPSDQGSHRQCLFYKFSGMAVKWHQHRSCLRYILGIRYSLTLYETEHGLLRQRWSIRHHRHTIWRGWPSGPLERSATGWSPRGRTRISWVSQTSADLVAASHDCKTYRCWIITRSPKRPNTGKYNCCANCCTIILLSKGINLKTPHKGLEFKLQKEKAVMRNVFIFDPDFLMEEMSLCWKKDSRSLVTLVEKRVQSLLFNFRSPQTIKK